MTYNVYNYNDELIDIVEAEDTAEAQEQAEERHGLDVYVLPEGVVPA